MTALSDRQRRILHFIVDFTELNDYPPTIREIGEQVGISSTSVVNYNLTKLEEMELLARRREVSRGLTLNRPRLHDLGIIDDNGHPVPVPAKTGSGGSNGRSSRRAPRPPVTDDAALPSAAAGVKPSGKNGMAAEPRRTPDVDAEDVAAARPGRPFFFQVPLLGKIAAGRPIQVDGRDAATAEDFIPLAQGLLGSPDNLFALRVQGNSMIDASVLDGDIVILRHQETAEDGDMVAAWIEDAEETTLKFLFREGPNVRLQPANPDPEYKPIVRPADKVRINGKVVSVIRVFKH